MRALVPILALASCGQDTRNGVYIPITMFDELYRDAYCTHAVACGLVADHDTCLTMKLPQPFSVSITPDIEAAILAGKIYYSSANLAACFDAIAKRTCDTTDADDREPLQACEGLFRGAVASGGVCALDAECASQVCGRNCGELSCCQGACVGETPPQMPTPKPIGQACLDGLCVANAYCEPSTKVCTALKSMTTPCKAITECAFGLVCDAITMTCKRLPGRGEGCSLATRMCRDEGDYCDETATCVAVGLPGDSCDPSLGSQAGCSVYYQCDSATMKCKPRPALGESCLDVPCADADAYCTTTTNLCAPSRAAGESCVGNAVTECQPGAHCDIPTLTCVADAICS